MNTAQYQLKEEKDRKKAERSFAQKELSLEVCLSLHPFIINLLSYLS